MFAIDDAAQLKLISGGPAGGGGPPGAPSFFSFDFGMGDFAPPPIPVVIIGPPDGWHRNNGFVDGALVSTTGRVAGVAATAFVDGFVVGAEIGAPGGPWAVLIGLVVGVSAAGAAYWLISPP